jgi:carbamoyltransferase
MIRSTGSDKLVMTGGTALNCIANMRLLEHFDEAYYQRYLGRKTRLQLWVPPTPGDAGAPLGAAYAFAMKNGVRPKANMRHAFYCGSAPALQEINAALEQSDEIEFTPLGNVNDPERRRAVADLAALVISRDGVMGIYQGPAETGPRALGHRSILAIRATRTRSRTSTRWSSFASAFARSHRWLRVRRRCVCSICPRRGGRRLQRIQLHGACRSRTPGGVCIGSCRDPSRRHRPRADRAPGDRFRSCMRFSKRWGGACGVEVAVNTSLNVGSPIVQDARAGTRRAEALKGPHRVDHDQ